MPGRRATEPERRDQILAAAMSVATAEGLEGLTVRRVADAAGLSHGLVHFHFQTKDDLTSALLGRVLRSTLSAGVFPASPGEPPRERLLAVMLGEMRRLAASPGLTRLFFDFWLTGARHPSLRTQIRKALLAYRRSFRPLVADVLAAEPERFSGVTTASLVAVVVAFIKGSALQAMIDPDGFDARGFTAAATGILGRDSLRLATSGSR
jgi:TetR/AcrR family transcriptional regulator, transcriptional repressor of bet genes